MAEKGAPMDAPAASGDLTTLTYW